MIDLRGRKVAYYGYTGLVDSAGATRLCQALNMAANSRVEVIYLCFSSPGGLVGDGIYLYNYIRALPVEMVMHAIGTVASIATTVFVAAQTRYCSANAMFMMHPTTVGPFSVGVAASHLQSALDSVVADDERTERILRERTSLNDGILLAKRSRDVHLTPQEALKFGLVHDVVEFSVAPGNQLIQI